ncbi:uncharacterized protein M6B38_134695 [Iris pallida]|uniref:U3 small nucleolar RNA-associated protein 14 n=1 Tax=Iris pallida TaxID=29817 RepID=A0AAX6FGF0_IRIPA|nr:uncharacterized protein M6B38_134695 [Iris pallida]
MKRKSRVVSESLTLENQKKKKKTHSKTKKESRKTPTRKSGPRLPSSFRKEIELLNPNPKNSDSDGEDEEGGIAVRGDLYEYEEEVPEEESKKNRRYDPVENYEYELPDDFKDENVPSDEDEDIVSERSDGEEEEEEGDKHTRMLEGITGMPGGAFNGEKKKVVLSDFQGGLDEGNLSINDLLDPLHGKPGYSKLRKRVQHIETKSAALQAPLPKVERERLERKVAYEHSKKDITKWEPLVKRNREAPTLYFEDDVDAGVSTVGAIASEFEPRTDFEKKMALLVRDSEIAEAHWKDGAKLLELNMVSVEDVRERQNRLAKMRSLLFRHEIKAKHIKKIKSKTYHRLLKKDKRKVASVEAEMDPEAVKEDAMKQEFKRAEERMTLKHKNSSKWAKRVLKRGLQAQDEGTRAAISDQLQQHALLTRKMSSMKDGSSSDESSDDDDDDEDELSHGTESDKVSKLLNKAKEKTVKLFEEEDEMPKSGVLSLPFMVRGLKKQKEAAYEEARLALQEYDSSLGNLEDGDGAESKSNKKSGRQVFGTAKQQSHQPSKRIELDNAKHSDSEDDFEPIEYTDEQEVKNGSKEAQFVSAPLLDGSDMDQKAVFKNFDDIIKDPGPKTTYDVAIFASGSWKKQTKGEDGLSAKAKKSAAVDNPSLPSQDTQVMDHNSDSDSEEEMVDGVLSFGTRTDYELPSQADLIHSAFAGDDVEAEFEKDKMEVLNEENPEPEKPVLLPGWGQWTNVQHKRGPPSWMLQEHEIAKRKREDALKMRKDSNLKNVIISEKLGKKAEKLHARVLPFPYKSKEVYEQSIRMPLGPEYNPAISVGALNRPAVVKKAGMIIKPIRYEEVDPYGKSEEHQLGGKKANAKIPNAKRPTFAGKGPSKKKART